MREVISSAVLTRGGWRFWVGILLSLACLAWLVWSVDWVGVGKALAETDYRLVLVAALLNLSSVLLRTLRWRLMFPPSAVPPFGELIRALLIGQAVNILAPARLGDLVRASLVRAASSAYALGTLMVEIGLDLLMLAVLVLLLLSQVALPTWWRGSGQVLVVVAAVALTAGAVLAMVRGRVRGVLEGLQSRPLHPLLHRLLAGAGQMLHGLDFMGQPALFLVLGSSVLIWIMYATVNYILLGAVGEQPVVLAALFLLAVLQLGVAVPSSPGRIGVFHYLCVQALAVFGISGHKALSYAIILHLISVVLPIVLGAGLAWQRGVSLHPHYDRLES